MAHLLTLYQVAVDVNHGYQPVHVDGVMGSDVHRAFTSPDLFGDANTAATVRFFVWNTVLLSKAKSVGQRVREFENVVGPVKGKCGSL